MLHEFHITGVEHHRCDITFLFFFINLFYSGTLQEYNSYFLVLCKKTNPDFFGILRTLTWLLAISEFSEKWRFGAFFNFFFIQFAYILFFHFFTYFLFFIPDFFGTLQENNFFGTLQDTNSNFSGTLQEQTKFFREYQHF